MKTKDITITQYARYYGCSTQNITKRIRRGNALKLPHVIRLKNWGRFYTLEVPEYLTAETFSTDLIKYRGKLI